MMFDRKYFSVDCESRECSSPGSDPAHLKMFEQPETSRMFKEGLLTGNFEQSYLPHHNRFGNLTNEVHKGYHSCQIQQQQHLEARRKRHTFDFVSSSSACGSQQSRIISKANRMNQLRMKKFQVQIPTVYSRLGSQEEQKNWEVADLLHPSHKLQNVSIRHWPQKLNSESHNFPAVIYGAVDTVPVLGKSSLRHTIIDQQYNFDPSTQMRTNYNGSAYRKPVNTLGLRVIEGTIRAENVNHNFKRRKNSSHPKRFSPLERNGGVNIEIVRHLDTTPDTKNLGFWQRQSVSEFQTASPEEQKGYINSSENVLKRTSLRRQRSSPAKLSKSPHEGSKRRRLFHKHSSSLLVSSLHSHVSVSTVPKRETTKKRFPCPECGKLFARRYYVNQHMRIHRNYYPFQCSYCVRKFKHQSNLIAHEQGHTKLYRFKCSHCPSGYPRRDRLVRHLKNKHGCK
mmetsp:Transcript_28859/g.39826  ORF Transcript_28859/g.39826 Transcript_28859/m.39826 type:complete len:453 (-) Transcript_28859:50-1408(-)